MLTHSIYERDIRVRRYAEYLAADGDCVDVISMRSDQPEGLPAVENVRVYPVPIERTRQEGLRLILLWMVSAVTMFFYLTALDIRRRYDLVHVHNMPDFLVFCALIPRLRGCPVLLNVHDPVPEVTMSKLGLPRNHSLVRIQVWLERICIRFSSHVLTATASFKKILIERGVPEEKITVITNAADSRFFKCPDRVMKTSPHNGRFTLLYVGTVAYRYGLDVAVRALPALRQAIPGLRLRVVPKILHEGAGLDASMELARELGVDDLIQLDDPVPLEQMPDIMEQADIGLYPARRDCHMDIALSLKIPEMAEMGLCIVASRLKVLEEHFGENAIAFVPPGDSEALAKKIIELYRSPEERQRLAGNALERSKELSWESQYQIYTATLAKLLN